jgi:hypothetical protein
LPWQTTAVGSGGHHPENDDSADEDKRLVWLAMSNKENAL